jgi:hypothetical protein
MYWTFNEGHVSQVLYELSKTITGIHCTGMEVVNAEDNKFIGKVYIGGLQS